MTKITLETLVEDYVQFIRDTASKNPDHLDALCNIADWADENGYYCDELVIHSRDDIYNLKGQ